MSATVPATDHVLSQDEWLPHAEAHAARVDRYAVPFLERRHTGRKHPVEDFLFTYYTHKPGQLRRWHPGAGTVLLGAHARERQTWKHYRALTPEELDGLGLSPDAVAVTVDVEGFLTDRREAVDFARIILGGTLARPAQFGCFGLHEWAMVYRQEKFELRHEYLGLRLGGEATDQVVEGHRIRCSHFDAFRFYTPDATPLNELQPTRETQRDLEQPGCLHANMDVYKWAYKLTPVLPSKFVMDCFELSYRIRAMDMQASPYDLAAWGYDPIRIETPEGKAEYVARQRGFAEETQELRARFLELLDRTVPSTPQETR